MPYFFPFATQATMGFITFDEARAAAQTRVRLSNYARASVVLEQEIRSTPIDQTFDIFLSHCYNDAKVDGEVLLGLEAIIERFGYSVYVDWVVDPQLDRTDVTKETASLLRTRMRNSRCLFFATSTSSSTSKWMPWELGYKDGQSGNADKRGRVAILPLAEGTETRFAGQEYLGVYSYVWTTEILNKPTLFIRDGDKHWSTFDAWLDGAEPKPVSQS